MRRPVIALVAATALLAVAGVVFLRVQREREWAHGGDRLTVDVEVAVATDETFEGVAVRLGAPPNTATRYRDADQSIVVHVRWSGLPRSGGSFQLIALDERFSPSRPLAADGGWNSDGATGSNWSSAYEELAHHYDWLGGVAAANYADVNGIPQFSASAVSGRATAAGTMTAWFRQWGGDRIPLSATADEIAVALLHVDESGDVRWARRLSAKASPPAGGDPPPGPTRE